jgi:hypothetical protein
MAHSLFKISYSQMHIDDCLGNNIFLPYVYVDVNRKCSSVCNNTTRHEVIVIFIKINVYFTLTSFRSINQYPDLFKGSIMEIGFRIISMSTLQRVGLSYKEFTLIFEIFEVVIA